MMTEPETGDCDTCCVTCCCVGCSALGYVFCVKEMRRSIRIKLFLIYLNILCVTFGVLTGALLFGPYDSSYTATDMRWVKDRLSFIFCDGVTISSIEGDSENSFSAYILDSKPVVNKTKRQTFKTETTFFIDEQSYTYHEFYLLSGSVVTVNVCVDSFTQIYFIKGKRNLKDFIDNNFLCDDCFEKDASFYQSKCTKQSDFVSTRYVVSDTSEYYIVYVSANTDAWVTSKYNIDRTLYDVSNARYSYSSVFRCEFSLDLKDEFVVVQLDDSTKLDQYHVVSACIARTWVYLLIFFIIPYFIGITICVLIYKFCKDPDPAVSSLHTSTSSLRASLLHSYTDYQSTRIIGPPKYEDIVRSDEAKPPSYDEAIGSINNGMDAYNYNDG